MRYKSGDHITKEDTADSKKTKQLWTVANKKSQITLGFPSRLFQ